MSEANDDLSPFTDLVKHYKGKSDVFDVFGVILYTRAHPYVTKVLNDDDFWAAFDEASGQRWVVFANRPGDKKKAGQLLYGVLANLFYKAIGEMLPMQTVMETIPNWDDPNDNLKLLKFFGVESADRLPLLLVFTELKSGEILQMEWKFSANNKPDAFNSLNATLKKAASALDQVLDENIKNNQEVFNLMEGEKIRHQILTGIKKAATFGLWVKSQLGK